MIRTTIRFSSNSNLVNEREKKISLFPSKNLWRDTQVCSSEVYKSFDKKMSHED